MKFELGVPALRALDRALALVCATKKLGEHAPISVELRRPPIESPRVGARSPVGGLEPINAAVAGHDRIRGAPRPRPLPSAGGASPARDGDKGSRSAAA